MIFRQIEEIRSGKKRQARRIDKGEQITETIENVLGYKAITKVSLNGRLKWQTGKTYAAIPKRGAKRFGNYMILNIRYQRLQEITLADALQEGVESVEEYRDLWESINGKTKGARWNDNPNVWIIEFQYIGDVEAA